MNTAKVVFPLAGLLALTLVCADVRAQEWRANGGRIGSANPAPANLAIDNGLSTADPASEKPADPNWIPEFLKRLPKPPDQLSSLFQPAPAPAPFECSTKPGPYLEYDPLLDPAEFGEPGWFTSLDFQVAIPHVFKSVGNNVTAGGRPTDVVALPVAPLDWTIIPRVELGYMLPSGFGGFALSYRFFGTSGTGPIMSPDGPATLRSRLDFNMFDVDYVSRVYAPWDKWTMQWRVGPRFTFIYYDSMMTQDATQAAGGSGILTQHTTNKYGMAFGPHASFELTRQLRWPGFSALARLDVGTMVGRIKQNVSETAVDQTSPTGVSFGESPLSSTQTVPTANLRVGLNYHSSNWKNVDAFIGYQYEYWWNVGRLSIDPLGRGEMAIQGIVARLQINY